MYIISVHVCEYIGNSVVLKQDIYRHKCYYTLMNINTILFDWDGTLAQTLEVWLQTFKEAFAKVNIYPSDKDISSRFGNQNLHIELGVVSSDIETYSQHLETVYEKLEKVELYPGAANILDILKANGYKLGLVSSSTNKMLQTALKANDLSDMFDCIVGADDTDKHKPDPKPLFIAIKKLGTSAESTIFVGDSDKDTGASFNANIPLLLFAPPHHDLYYDLDDLKDSPSVIASFSKWKEFPLDVIKNT